MVSTIDDFERETRTWLKQCMQQISGYPDVETVGVKSWTTNTRPSSNPNSNLLLGYNTTTGSLELIGQDGTVTEILSNAVKKQIALMAHPVGEYYWTSDASFNPNTAWGGTWVRIQDGRCLISNNSSYSVGSTGGAETVVLSKNNLPPIILEHNHGVGSFKIDGSVTSVDRDSSDGSYFETLTMADEIQSSGALSVKNRANAWGYRDSGNKDNAGYRTIQLLADSMHGFTGHSTSALTNVGGGTAHNNMQPYRTAVCWHRTA